MVVSSKSGELQANAAVNKLLGSMIPGAKKLGWKTKGKSEGVQRRGGSHAQLIEKNSKEMLMMKAEDTRRIKKKLKLDRKKKVRNAVLKDRKMEKLAQDKVLELHREQGVLSKLEKKRLREIELQKKAAKASIPMVDSDAEDEVRDLQNYVLRHTQKTSKSERSHKRRAKKKNFKESILSSVDKMKNDRRYPGLTPGLAPVDMSDEEDSSSDDDNGDE